MAVLYVAVPVQVAYKPSGRNGFDAVYNVRNIYIYDVSHGQHAVLLLDKYGFETYADGVFIPSSRA